MPDNESKTGQPHVQLRPDLLPTEQGLFAPAIYVNQMRVVHDEDGFRVYFFELPPDVAQSQMLRDQVEEIRAAVEAGDAAPESVRLTLEPVVTLRIPRHVMGAFIEALQKNHATWRQTFGGDE